MRPDVVPGDHRQSEYFAINKLHLLERQYHSALDDLEKEQDVSFNVFSDVLLPVSLLFFVVVWGYQLNAMTVDTSESGGDGGGSAENRAMLLVYGIGLIVISGTACVYVAMRMTAVRPKRAAAEIRPLYAEHGARTRKYYHRTIPEVHGIGKKPKVNVFVV